MKNILLLMVSVLIFTSCEKDSTLYSNKLEATEYGKIHNEGLDIILNYKDNNKSTPLNNAQMLELMYNEMKVKHPNIFIDTIVDFDNLATEYFANQNVANFDYRQRYNTLIIKAIEEGKCTEKIKNILDNLIFNPEYYVTNSNINNIFLMIENYKSSNNLSENETYQLNILKSTLLNSNNYWLQKNINKRSNYRSTDCDPNHQIYLVDGVMGTVGSIFTGPFGALIGAGFSALTYEAQEQNGGGCI